MMFYQKFKFVLSVFVAVMMLSSGALAQGLDQLAQSHDELNHETAQAMEEIEPGSGVASVKDMPEQEETVDSDPSYVLGVDDVIKVTVYGEGDLSSVYKIGGTGLISFPLIGEIEVSGKTTRQVEQTLREKLSDDYLVNPNVSVEVATYRPFYILGEVREPGSYAYTNGATVLKAVALAGGFTYRANKKEVQILKTKNSSSGLYDKVSVNTAIGPGDIILVKERFF